MALAALVPAFSIIAEGCSVDAPPAHNYPGSNGGSKGSGSGATANGNNAASGGGGDNGGAGTFGSGGTDPSKGGACVNLQCNQVQCSGGGHTTVSGTIYDPAGRNPLYNVVVYVPNSQPSGFADHASCDQCSALYTGNPIVTALTGPDGRFTLTDVPAGNNVPLVIQIGKWRRQITIPTVAACTDTPLADPNLTRLPKNRGEGDLPKIAISTGGADSMECLLRRIGVDPLEFAGGAGTGRERIHVFQGTQGHGALGSTPSNTSLWANQDELLNYDLVILSCEGGENGNTKPANSLQALQSYANAGGRVFASHFHYYWFSSGPAPFPNTANWRTGSNDIGDISGAIDQTFPKGVALAQWLRNVNALQGDGTLPIQQARHNADVSTASNAGSQSWITNATPGKDLGAAQYFTFNTPVGAPDAAQCGRVVYSDLHVGAASNDFQTSPIIPDGCTDQDLSPQEKALEFMLFDLSSCVTPDSEPPAPPSPVR